MGPNTPKHTTTMDPLKERHNSAWSVTQTECSKIGFRTFEKCHTKQHRVDYFECDEVARQMIRICFDSWGVPKSQEPK